MGNVSATTAPDSARLVCWNCGSHGIIKGPPEVSAEREAVAVAEREGSSFGRREILGWNQGCVIFGDFLPFQIPISGRGYFVILLGQQVLILAGEFPSSWTDPIILWG